MPETWFVWICLITAFVLGVTATDEDALFADAKSFLWIACGFLLVTCVASTIRASRTPGDFKAPRRDVFHMVLQLVLIAIQACLPLGFVVYRRVRIDSTDFGPFYRKVVVSFLKGVAIASCFLVVIVVGVLMDLRRPHPPSALEAGAAKVVAERQRQSIVESPLPVIRPPAPPPPPGFVPPPVIHHPSLEIMR